MAIASITEWLNSVSKNYQHGKMLYAQYGDKQYLKTLFDSGNSTFHSNKLQAALVELNKLNSPKPKNILIAEPPKPKVLLAQPLMEYKDAPEQILHIRDEKNKAYALSRKLFETIPYLENKAHRLEAGIELLQLRKYVQDCWQAIDEWKANGTIRELAVKKIESDATELSLAELIKEQKNLPPNISKDKTKLAKCTDSEKRLKLQNRINERTMRLEFIKERLNGFV
jgi:hypothetical protein